MSLTRDEWVSMWEQVKVVELEALGLPKNSRRRAIILRQVVKIKYLIQSVIGQME